LFDDAKRQKTGESKKKKYECGNKNEGERMLFAGEVLSGMITILWRLCK